MLSDLMLLLSTAISPMEQPQQVQSRNDEFIFSKYPPRALAAREQGAVRFRAEVNDKGLPIGCEVIQSSGHWRLDRETCDLIVQHATFRPTLDEKGKARGAVHDGIVNWRIPGAPDAALPIKLVDSKPTEKLICKRTLKTGSLVKHSRVCMTARDWDRYAEANQEDWGSLQGKKGHTNAGMPTWTIGQ